jgi:hypothetical protein
MSYADTSGHTFMQDAPQIGSQLCIKWLQQMKNKSYTERQFYLKTEERMFEGTKLGVTVIVCLGLLHSNIVLCSLTPARAQ